MRSKRQVSLRELEMKTVRTKTTGTMHPFDLWFYPALHSHYYPPSLHRQHITDKGTFGIALAAPLFLFVQAALYLDSWQGRDPWNRLGLLFLSTGS